MREERKTPEQEREKIRQEELKRNPTGNMNDSLNRAESGSLVDLVNGLGWKGTGALIIAIIVGFVVVSLFMSN